MVGAPRFDATSKPAGVSACGWPPATGSVSSRYQFCVIADEQHGLAVAAPARPEGRVNPPRAVVVQQFRRHTRPRVDEIEPAVLPFVGVLLHEQLAPVGRPLVVDEVAALGIGQLDEADATIGHVALRQRTHLVDVAWIRPPDQVQRRLVTGQVQRDRHPAHLAPIDVLQGDLS